jgi:serpin B
MRAPTLLLASTLSALLAGCPAGEEGGRRPADEPAPPSAPAEDTKAVAAGTNQFAVDVYGAIASTKGDLFFSPASIAAAFGMTLGGAREATAEQLTKALHLALPPERAHPALGALLASPPTSTGGPEFSVANRLWGAQEDFLPAFLQLTRDAYGAELERVDFRGQPEQARARINGWVAERTRDRIKDLLADGSIVPSTRLVLTNAVYFKGAWRSRFDPAATRTGRFTLASGTAVEVPLMAQTLEAAFHQGEGFALVELPYEGDRYALVVIVPDAHDGLPAVERSLSAQTLAAWLGAASSRKVLVALPRLKIEATLDLVPVLQALGVKDLFAPGSADLSGMNGARDLYVGVAVHKGFVEVNEEGTEAAAATAIAVERTSAPQELCADRPFLFLIRDRETGVIWFMGRETDPRS